MPPGENEVVLAEGYAANLEVASAEPQAATLTPAGAGPEPIATPGMTTITDVAAHLGLEPSALLKAYPVVVADGQEGERLVLVLVRGDHRVGEVKLANALGAAPRQARVEEIEAALGPPGFIGPVGVDTDVEILLDTGAAGFGVGGYVIGAGRVDEHLVGVVPGRDFAYREVDVREVGPGDTVAGATVTIEPAIEIGNIFKLGTRYSEPLGARYLDENGAEQLIWMGSYGIGPARIVAAAVEQFADEHGIAWPRALAPFAVHLVALGKPGTPERDAADALYETLLRGWGGGPLRRPRSRHRREVRRRRAARLPGAADRRAPLAGVRRGRGAAAPRPPGGSRAGADGRARRDPAGSGRAVAKRLRTCREDRTLGCVPGRCAGCRVRLAGYARASPSVAQLVQTPRPPPIEQVLRLFGLDRSGPPPTQTQAGQPLRPWTLPNAIGFARLALIPVFLVVALSQRRRHRRAPRDAVRA